MQRQHQLKGATTTARSKASDRSVRATLGNTNSKSKIDTRSNNNSKVKGLGQECPSYTCNTNTRSNGNSLVKGLGQECPSHTGNCNIKNKSNIKINC
jgi:hypothetical protein